MAFYIGTEKCLNKHRNAEKRKTQKVRGKNMAEEIKTNVDETTEPSVTDNAPNAETVSKSEYERLKASLDKALKEKGDITKQLRAKQSEDERIAEEQAEAQRIRDEEFEATKAELNRMKAVGAYKSISSEKVVENLIEAVSNADHSAIALIIENEIKAAVKVAQTDWLKSRPQANVGSYSAMTKEQIMAIPDREARTRAIAQNQNLF